MITDKELVDMFEAEIEAWKRKGDKHYDNTPDWRIFEMYYDKALDKVLEHLNLDEKEAFEMSERIEKLFY